MRDWPVKSKENSKEYGTSRQREQPLPQSRYRTFNEERERPPGLRSTPYLRGQGCGSVRERDCGAVMAELARNLSHQSHLLRTGLQELLVLQTGLCTLQEPVSGEATQAAGARHWRRREQCRSLPGGTYQIRRNTLPPAVSLQYPLLTKLNIIQTGTG